VTAMSENQDENEANNLPNEKYSAKDIKRSTKTEVHTQIDDDHKKTGE
jgi:hypothetical protein